MQTLVCLSIVGTGLNLETWAWLYRTKLGDNIPVTRLQLSCSLNIPSYLTTLLRPFTSYRPITLRCESNSVVRHGEDSIASSSSLSSSLERNQILAARNTLVVNEIRIESHEIAAEALNGAVRGKERKDGSIAICSLVEIPSVASNRRCRDGLCRS